MENNRVIKFRRAHFKDEEKKMFSHFTEWGVGIGHTTFTSPSTNNYAEAFIDLQYIGLQDSEGRDRCEGDIVNFWGGVGKIVYRDLDAGFKISHKHGAFFDISPMDETIGDIYQNPELLTK